MKYCVCSLLIAASLSLPQRATALAVIALTENDEVMVVDAAVPQNILSIRPVTGLGLGEDVLGIDTRPSDGKLYALTAQFDFSNPRLFTIDPSTGAATLVAALAADPADLTSPFVGLLGNHFAIDFNPQADRLRLVSDMGANLRINPNNGLVTTDTDLAYATPLDQPPKINAIAYANNVAGATSTRLFGIDDANFKIAEQNPPNNGTLSNPIDFGVPNASHPGFDIAPNGVGYVAGKHNVPNTPTEWILATVDPLTGEGESHGPIGDGSIPVRDIAVATSLAFSKPLFSAFEDVGSATITVVREGFLNVPLTVQFSTSSGNASAASDYTTASGVLNFAAGEAAQTFQVPVINDALPEGDEFVNLLLSGATGPVVLGPPAAAQLRINASDRDDQVGPQVLFIGLTGPSRAIDGAVVFFNEDMDANAATNLTYYSLTAAPRKGKPAVMQFDSAVYDPTLRMVTLKLNQGFMQTESKKLAVRIRSRGTTGVKDAYGNLLDGNRDGKPGGDAAQLFKVFSGETLNFRDRDGDKVTLELTGGGHLDGVLPLGGPPDQQTQFWIVDPISLVTRLSGSVTKSRTGNGIVVVAEIIGLDKKEITPIISNPSFQFNRLTFSPNATGMGL